MGSYLSVPVREKLSDDYTGEISYGASSMQGWRASQEDAHNCQVNFDPDSETSLFAVYDGHGGAEVAIYTSKYFPDFLKRLSTYKSGDLHKALEEAFIGFDATLVEEGVVKQLKDIAGVDLNGSSDEDEEVKNEAALLKEEATMPIEKLMQRYKGGKANHSLGNQIKGEDSEEGSKSNGSESDVKTNGFHENDKNEDDVPVENISKVSKTGESDEASKTHDSSDQVDKKDMEPHCSKAADEEEEDDTDDSDDDSEDDKWNSEENDSDDDEDDDEEEDNDSISLTKLFKGKEDDDCEPLSFGEMPGADSGCTAVVALLRGQDLYVANAGDSRCVVCRGQTAVDMSVDHKPEDEIEKTRIYKAGGKITADGRVNGGLNLSRAIGDHAYKRNTKLELRDQMITSLPDVKHMTIEKDDRFMVLACDGIWNVLTSQEVVDFILKRMEMGETKLSTICEELFETCLAPDTSGDGTGCDNMTCIIVKFPSAEKVTETVTQAKCSKRKRSGDVEGDELPAKRSHGECDDSNS